jgi:two-component system sensor histidine kinase CpxA
MHNLLAKVFLAYWLAAGAVIMVSDLQPHKLIHTPELADALDTSLAITGGMLTDAYQRGTCPSPSTWKIPSSDAISLASADGRVLCGNLPSDGLGKLISGAVSGKKRLTRDFLRYQIIATPIPTTNGATLVLLMKSHYVSTLEIFGFLPGPKTIEISIGVTFFLAILVVLPIRRLRTTARQIADGNLTARVRPGRIAWLFSKLYLRDDIDGLMRDFNAMAERLESLVNAQKLLLRDVSHELRSPLARLAVALEHARDMAGESLRPHLDRIERESLRLNGLISHILSFSYIEGIRAPRHSAALSLRSLIGELLPDIQYEADRRSCRIVTCVRQDLVVNGDSEMLRHAVENIVRNAIRYSPDGGTVEIDIDRTEEGGRSGAVLRVSDTGPGVAEEKLSLILNPFYRAGDTRRSTSSGFGIGLAIADRAAHLHSGKIVARNRKGGGLIVEMCLPLEPSLS